MIEMQARFHLYLALLICARGRFEVTAEVNSTEATSSTSEPFIAQTCDDIECPPGNVCVNWTLPFTNVESTTNGSQAKGGGTFVLTNRTHLVTPKCQSCSVECDQRKHSTVSADCIDFCPGSRNTTGNGTVVASPPVVPPLNLTERLVCGTVAFLLCLGLCVVVRKFCIVLEDRMTVRDDEEVMAIIDNADEFDANVDVWVRPPRRRHYVRTVSQEAAATSSEAAATDGTISPTEDSSLRDWGSRPTETSSGSCATSPSYGATSVAIIDASTVEIHV